jgi:hypothetical protein
VRTRFFCCLIFGIFSEMPAPAGARKVAERFGGRPRA